MKNIIIFLLILLTSVTFSQGIRGKIVDEKNEPISGANIYFDGTSIATTSNSRGFFELNISVKTNANLVVSYVGYQTVYINSHDENKEYLIQLIESVNELNEVVIKKNRFTRKQQLELFRNEFLGNTKAGRKAKILNEDELEFDYDEVRKTFKVSADKPLIIENPVLGYEVTYEIKDFIVFFRKLSINSDDVSKLMFTGVSRFEEIDSSEEVKNQRENSYLGSTVHFFRSLASNTLFDNKFILVKNNKLAPFQENFVVKDTIGYREITLKNMKQVADKKVVYYQIVYNDKANSTITLFTPVFYIDEFGINTNVKEILFSGDISKKRVADLLPTNYGILKENKKL